MSKMMSLQQIWTTEESFEHLIPNEYFQCYVNINGTGPLCDITKHGRVT